MKSSRFETVLRGLWIVQLEREHLLWKKPWSLCQNGNVLIRLNCRHLSRIQKALKLKKYKKILHSTIRIICWLTWLSHREAYKPPPTPPLKTCPSHHSPTGSSPALGTGATTVGCICPSPSSYVSFVLSRGGFGSKSLNFLCAADKEVLRAVWKVGIVQIGWEVWTWQTWSNC